MSKLIEIKDLKTNFYTYEGIVQALDGINLSMREGEILGLVGETGCGKSVTALSILRLIRPPGKIEAGEVLLRLRDKSSQSKDPVDLLDQTELLMQKVRGNEISMIFQEASEALNPVYSVNDQVSESFLLHRQKELCQDVLKKIEQDLGKGSSLLRRIILKMERRIYLRMRENPSSSLLAILAFLPIVGSYKRRMVDQARAMAILCLWPPLNSCG